MFLRKIFNQSTTSIIGALLFVLISFSSISAQNQIIDSLYNIYHSTNDLKHKSTVCTDLAWEFLYLEPKKTLEFGKEALAISKEINNPIGISTAEGTIGLYHDVAGNYDQAIVHYLNAIRILEEHSGYELNIASNYSNVSIVFSNLENYEKALHYSHKALSYERKVGVNTGMVYSYVNIASIHRSLNNLDSSLYYHNQVIKLGKKLNFIDYKIDLINLGNIYLEMDQYDSANYYYHEFLSYVKALDPPAPMRQAYAYDGLNQLYSELGDYRKSKAYLDSAWNINETIGNNTIRQDLYEGYIKYYTAIDDFENAFLSLTKMTNLSDSLESIDLKETIANLETKFQTEQKDNKINQLTAEVKIQELEVEKTKSQRRFLIAIVLLVILILIILFILYHLQSKANKALEYKNEVIENLIRESHHRIKNNLQVVSSLLNLQGMSASSEEAQKAISDAQSRIKSIAILHQRLQGSNDFSSVNLKTYLPELINTIVQSLSNNNDQVDMNMGIDDISLEVDKTISLGLILNEWITNSFKYAKTNEDKLKLSIVLERKKSGLALAYKDNGPGLPKNFDLKKSSSLGYNIINSLIVQLNSELKLLDKSGGFSAVVNMPYE